jgi:purine-binding chemotaxis protein CheW
MSTNALALASSFATANAGGHLNTMREFVTMRIGGQLFGISVMAVQDVIRKQRVTGVPHAPMIVAGVLNLRGRIVTAIDMRKRLGLEPYPDPEKIMKVVVEYQHELFALMVDAVGDVLTLSLSQIERSPANLNETWKQVSAGVYKLDKELLVVLDIANVVQP